MYICFETDSRRLAEWLLDILFPKDAMHKLNSSDDDRSKLYIITNSYTKDDEWFNDQFFNGTLNDSITGAYRVGEFKIQDPGSLIRQDGSQECGRLPIIEEAFGAHLREKDKNLLILDKTSMRQNTREG